MLISMAILYNFELLLKLVAIFWPKNALVISFSVAIWAFWLPIALGLRLMLMYTKYTKSVSTEYKDLMTDDNLCDPFMPQSEPQ